MDNVKNEAFNPGTSIQGEFEMSGNKMNKHGKMDRHGDRVAAAELIEQYRPLGLKAVLAAAMQVKPKPAQKPVALHQMSLPKQSA